MQTEFGCQCSILLLYKCLQTNVIHGATSEQLEVSFICFFNTLGPLLKWASLLRHKASCLTGRRKILNPEGPRVMAVKGV